MDVFQKSGCFPPLGLNDSMEGEPSPPPARRTTGTCPRAWQPPVSACTLCARAEAKSDLVNVLSSLEAHWHVLEAEVIEINRDIEYSEQCLRKYGEWFSSPLQYLRELKRTKKNKMCAAPTAHRPPPAQRARRLLRATQHARYTHSRCAVCERRSGVQSYL